MVTASAFMHLDAPLQDILVRQRRAVNMLPTSSGVYALYDRSGELLYIGKASDLRSRVQSHLRGGSPGGLLPDWQRSIHWIEARLAASETEAMLIEAELIGRLAPPLNRRMRSWSRYCYLVASDDVSAPLFISCQALPWRRCFGPYRTRRQALAVCDAVFRAIHNRPYQNGRLSSAYALLAGEDGALAAEAEMACQVHASDPPQDRRSRMLVKQAKTLRQAFDRALLLGVAKKMLAAMLLIPSDTVTGHVAVIAADGLFLDAIGQSEKTAAAFLSRYRKRTSNSVIEPDRPLSKEIADILCVAARRSQHAQPDFQHVPADRAVTLNPLDVLALACADRDAGAARTLRRGPGENR